MGSKPFPMGDFDDLVVSRIMELSDDESLRDLQLVCRDIRRIGRIVFAKRFMSARYHIFTKHSLEALVTISTIPIYACQVRTVMLDGSRISAGDLEYAEAFPDIYDIEPIHPGGPMRNALRYAQQVQASQDAIQTNGVGMNLLVTAMQRFSLYPNKLCLGTWQDGGDSLPCGPNQYVHDCSFAFIFGYGSRQLAQELEGGVLRDCLGEATSRLIERGAISFESRLKDTMHFLMDAAAKADCRNDTLLLYINREALDSSDLRIGLLNHIRQMEIGIQCNTGGHAFEHCDIVQNAIANTEGLETLIVDFYGPVPYMDFPQHVRSAYYFSLYFGWSVTQDSISRWRSLRRLSLMNAQASQDQLILLAQARQLDSLELVDCLPFDNSWMRLLEWIAINLPMLSRFSFTALDFGILHKDPERLNIKFVPYYLEGVHEVRNGLQHFLRAGYAHISDTQTTCGWMVTSP